MQLKSVLLSTAVFFAAWASASPVAIATPAPAPDAVKFALERRQAASTSCPPRTTTYTGSTIITWQSQVYTTPLGSGTFIKLSRRTTAETAWTDSVGPTPSFNYVWHFAERMRPVARVTGCDVDTWTQTNYCSANASFALTGNALDSIFFSPLYCEIKVQYPAITSERPAQCTHEIVGRKTWVPSLSRSATPVSDCLVKETAWKWGGNGDDAVIQYRKNDFEVKRWYDDRKYAWFEFCYDGPDPEKIKKRGYVSYNPCPIWDCRWESSSEVDQTPWHTNYKYQNAWFGLFNNTRGCGTMAVSRTCLRHDSVVFDFGVVEK